MFKDISRLLNSRINEIFASIFDKKNEMFKKGFFYFLLNVDINNINNFSYVNSQKLTRSTKKEINKAIIRLKVDKTFETNQILNKRLKMLRKTMTKKLIFTFQAFIDVEYHSKLFREVKIIVFKKINKKDNITLQIYRSITLLNIINKMLKSIIINQIIKLAKKISCFQNHK